MEFLELISLLENSSSPEVGIDKFDFFYVKTNELFRFDIDEDRLQSHFEYRVTLRRNEFFASELKSLARAIKKTEFRSSDRYIDLRYALVLYRGDKRVCSLFLNGAGTKLSLNYTRYKANGELVKWFKSIASRLVSIAKVD